MFESVNLFILFFALLVGHALADFPLQNDFLAQAKNPNNEHRFGKDVWKWALGWHSLIHAGFVFVITGFVSLALVELVHHAYTDHQKNHNRISFTEDQLHHIGAKAGYVFAIWIWSIMGLN